MSIAIVIPAAGASRRFGVADKLLAPFGEGGAPIVRHTVEAACRSRAGAVVVVVRAGPPGEAVGAALQGLDARIVVNPDAEAGMGSSVAVGVRSVGAAFPGIMVLPADMPWITAEWLDQLIAVFEAAEGRSIVVPLNALGEQRNPVIWPAELAVGLAGLTGEMGGKGLLARHADRVARVTAPGEHVLRDVDTPGDLGQG